MGIQRLALIVCKINTCQRANLTKLSFNLICYYFSLYNLMLIPYDAVQKSLFIVLFSLMNRTKNHEYFIRVYLFLIELMIFNSFLTFQKIKMAIKMNSLAFLPSGKLKQHFATLILYVSFTKRKEVGNKKRKQISIPYSTL